MLREEVKDYLEESGISKTLFCKRLDFTTQHLNQWLKGNCNISDSLARRIKEYLDKYKISK